MNFGSFLQGLQGGQQAALGRKQHASQMEQLKQRGIVLDEAGGYAGAGDYGSAASRAAQGGETDLAELYQSMNENQRAEAKERITRLGKVANAIMQIPPEQQAAAIQSYGAEFGFSPEQIQMAAAAPDKVLPLLVSQARDMETMIEQSIPEVRTEGEQMFAIRTGPNGQASVDELARRDTTFAETTARQNADTNRIKANKPSAPLVSVNTGDVGAGQRPIVDKPPKGFQRVYDAATNSYRDEPIQGSEAYTERAEAGSKTQNKMDTALRKRDLLFDQIDRAIEQSKGGNTGPIMGMNPLSTDLEATLNTIKANVGFAELQAMRDSSPTGGALGQVTEKEIAFLQALMGSMERRQSEGQLDQNLMQIKSEIAASYQRIEEAYVRDQEAGLFGSASDNSNSALTPDEQAELEQLKRELGVE